MSVPIGQRYAVTTAMGDAFAGDVWFRSAYQVELTVDGYGDGLVILGTRPTTAKSPHGGGSAVITTYRQDDHAFAGLRDRWTTWWSDRYEVIEIQPNA